MKRLRWKRLLAFLLTLCMVMGNMGNTVIASDQSETGVESTDTEETTETEAVEVSAETEIETGTETATELETEAGTETETETDTKESGEEESEKTAAVVLCAHGNDKDSCIVCEVEALIDELPTLAELAEMDTDGQNEVYAQASDICDIYYDELTDEEQEQVSNIDDLWDVLDYFSGSISLTASGSVTYIDENGSSQTYTGTYTEVTSSSSAVTWGTSGETAWYVVSGTVQCSNRVQVYGTVYLILASGCTLTVLNELNVDSSSTLIIYGGTATSGTLVATGTNEYKAGIGKGGTVIINSGTVTAKGGSEAAGIGGDGTIEINGGTVTATGGPYASGIGGNCQGTAGTIKINGGTVTATGGTNSAGIGNGYGGKGGTITITGGYINATADSYASAIGKARFSDDTITITITGGYFVQGDTSANTVYDISVDTNCCSVVNSGNSNYPYLVQGNSFTVSLTTNGGTINSGNVTNYTYGKGATLPTDVTKSGYIFGGWYEDSDFSSSRVIEISKTDYGDKTYYAKWVQAFVVSDSTCAYTYENQLLEITSGGECTISMNTEYGITSTTTDRIKVTSDDAVTITITSINVISSNASPFEIDGTGDVTIKLSGTNVLTASTITTSSDTGQYAGLQNTSGGTLTITSADGDGSTEGSLTVTGGGNTNYQNGGAGIGGAYGSSGGMITIKGGTINATGGWNSAGIGGGSGGAGSNSTDGITISGGTVTATSGASGAGIGGGTNGDSGNITISGGTVTATSSTNGAGIGAGRPLNNDTSVGTIKITGGEVNATSGGSGAGIGGGQGSDTYKTTGGAIEISGDAVVTAVSEGSGAGIGGGNGGDSGSITISGKADVTATAEGNGAGIGGGTGGSGESITISDNAIVIATGGDASDGTAGYGAGIGGGQDGNGGVITISGGTVTAASTGAGAGIGTGQFSSTGGITACSWTVTISGGTVNATGGAYIKGTTSTDAGGGAGIGCGYDSTGSAITVTGSIEISGDAEVTATGGYDCAAIGGTYLTGYGTISISGNVQVEAIGGAQAAGIGGGSSNSGGTVEISGGTVTATGGTGVKDTYGSGAGIGGGHSGIGGSITISGGTVTATGGGSETYFRGGAGIGSGGKSGSTVTTNSGDITISGGTVTATGGYNAAGIGGGYYYTGGSISITAGEVEATGGSGAAGIGGGYGGSGDTIEISGGIVTATGGTSTSTSTGSGAGIGGGGNSDGGTVTISGGTVTATGGGDTTYFYSGAGIGSGGSNGGSANSISSGTITISGDAVVNATGGQNGAGIGGGYHGYGYQITIDSGTVTATSGGPGAGIGGGINSKGGTIVINGGTVTATASSNGAGIGGGKSADSESITITGGTVTAKGTGAGAGIGGGSDGGSGGTITISGGYILATSGSGNPIGGGVSTTSGSNGSSGTITISGGCFGEGDKDAKTVYDISVVTWCYVTDNEEESTKTTHPYLVTECDHDYSEDGICSKCNYFQPADWDETNSRYEIGNPGQLLWFAALVNGDTSSGRVLFTDEDTARGASADAVLTADIDMSSYSSFFIPIGYTGADYHHATSTADISDWGYRGTFDGQGHVISNVTVSAVSYLDIGVFGTVSGTVKNLGICNFSYTHSDSTVYVWAGALAGQILPGGMVENCYVQSAAISCPSRVAGGLAGANYGGTVKNCYVVGSSVSGARYGGLVSDNNNDEKVSVFYGTVTNCYADGTLVSSNSSFSGTVNGGEDNVSAERFVSGEVAWLLQAGQDDESVLAWGQNLTGSTTDAYPVLTSTESLRVMKVAFYLVTGSTVASDAFETVYTNNGSALAESAYPTTGSSDSVYAFYTDSSCGSEYMIDTSEYAYDYETLGNPAKIYAQQVSIPAYIVTIPESVTLDGTSESTATLSASTVALASGSRLQVMLTGTSGTDNAFTLAYETDSLAYTLTADGTTVSVGDTLLTVAGGTAYKSGSTTLTFSSPSGTARYAGEYTGTLTFTVSVEND